MIQYAVSTVRQTTATPRPYWYQWSPLAGYRPSTNHLIVSGYIDRSSLQTSGPCPAHIRSQGVVGHVDVVTDWLPRDHVTRLTPSGS